jgi:hypothetical protein
MHKENFADAVGKRPVALLFSTPQLCQSRVCGPVTDIALQLEAECGDRMTFIHQEVYVDNELQKGLRPQLRAFHLETEPWLFTLDKEGRIAARLEGSFGVTGFRRESRPPSRHVRDCGYAAGGVRSAAFLCLVLLVLLAAGCGGDGSEEQAATGPKIGDPGPIHVHGLGVNPKDGALFVATHTGLFRVERGEQRASRVADRFQDTMGFTVVGPNRFLGSGHPDGREKLPPFLGLIESRDAGRTWRPVSLLGERDFHVLEAAGKRIYGFGSDFETEQAALLVSDDGGRSWEQHAPPEGLISLAIHPHAPDRIVVSGEEGLYSSSDAGGGWRPLDGEPALLAWPAPEALLAVSGDGTVARSGDAGRSWQELGAVRGRPAAFEAEGADELYVALHDGTVKRSTDGGTSWSVRSKP